MLSKNKVRMVIENKERIITAIEEVYLSNRREIEIASTMSTIVARDGSNKTVVTAVKNSDGSYSAEISGYYMTELYDALAHMQARKIV